MTPTLFLLYGLALSASLFIAGLGAILLRFCYLYLLGFFLTGDKS